MDELENQVIPPEPEDMEASEAAALTAQEPETENVAQTADPEEAADQPAAEVQAGEASVEELVEEAPAEEPVEEAPAAAEPAAARAASPAPQPPRRRSPYENSPYMMPHQPAGQTAAPAPAAQPAVEEKPKKERKKRPVLRAVLQVLVFTMLAFSVALLVSRGGKNDHALQIQALEERIEVLQAQLDDRENVIAGDSVSGTPNANPAGGLTPGQVYARNERSVALIETDMATGSGFILTADGYVVTNYHVVEDGSSITVVLFDRSYYDAELIGYDANNDIALLKMEGEGFQPVVLGSSDALIVGDQVVAIGNPLGELTATLTVGYVSAKGRDVSTDSATINMIQTDCAINSGNSGGPLFNMKGEVVGITTAKYSGMSSSGASIEGIGFAIPMDDVVDILEDLREYGYVKSGYLGVGVYSMIPSEAQMFNLPLGCLVDSVTPGSCADIAGLQPSDIIIGLGGYPVESYTDLGRALRKFEGGETTTITVYRNGQELVLSITLDEKPHENAVQQDPGTMPENGSYEEWYNYFFGE